MLAVLLVSAVFSFTVILRKVPSAAVFFVEHGSQFAS